MYIRRRPWECNIPLGGCQGHAPAGWLLPSPPALNLGTASCGAPCFEWRPVPIVGMGAHMVVGGISEFLHSLVQLLLRPEFIEVGALVLQGIEVPLHWRIVVWIPGFAHALGHMDGSAELYESLRCILAPLVAVQEQFPLCGMLGIQRLLQGAYGQVAGDVPVRYAGHHAPVIEVYDGAVVSDLPILQEQVCEIRAPFLVRLVRMEVLPQLVLEYFMGLPGLCPRFFRADDGMQAHLRVHIFMDGSGAVAIPFALQVGCHAAVAIDAVVPVVDFIYLPLDFCFLGAIIRLPVFPVVIVGIRANPQPPQ